MANNPGGSWKRLFSSAGRVSRTQFWKVFGAVFAVLAACRMAVALAGDSPVAALLLPFILSAVVIGLCNEIKRLHDLGRSGWLLLLVIGAAALTGGLAVALGGPAADWVGVALSYTIQIALLLVLGLVPGQSGPNRFGEPPTGPLASEFA